MQRKLWNKSFLLLLQGHAVSTIGDLMYSVAIGYWVYDKTGSTGLMGIMSSVSMFITMFLSPFAGSIVDRCNRKWMIVCIDAIQGILMLSVALLAYLNALNVPVVIIAAVVAAFGSVLFTPAVSTIMLDIIPRDDMVRGQSIYAASKSLLNLVGSAFSGAMVAFFGVPLIVALNGLSNLYSAATELFVSVPKSINQGSAVTLSGIIHDSSMAIRIIFTDRFLQLFVPCALVLNLLGSGTISLILPFCLEKGFTVDMYGYLSAVYMLFSLLGVVLIGAVKLNPKQRYWGMAIGFIMSLPFFVLAFMSKRFVPMCVMASLAAFCNVSANSIFNATMMLALPEEKRGAILGFIDAASIGGCALSVLIYGFLGEFFPLHLAFSVGTLLSIVPMLFMCLNPRTRNFMLMH